MACGSMPSLDQSAAVAPEITTGDNSVVESSVESTIEQDAVQTTGGSTAKAEHIDTVITENNTGTPWYVWLLIGLLMQQPFFVRWLFI